ncbi:MAG: isoprenyl transferase [Bacteroidaceae bacterium]|nr:isoprenyl transferase [Bacteroidaceae bacterium]
MSLLDKIDKERIPAHIAIIMDGNGRWAQAKGQPRTAGHAQGVEVVKNIAADAARIGVKFLTLYAFSTENWNRPTAEIEALMKLILDYLEEETFMKNNIRFRVIGGVELLPPAVQKRLNDCIEHTAANDRMTLTIALSYSSRWELTTTMQKMANDVKNGILQPEDITESLISSRLLTNFMPDPDLLIRTGGELRISNYLLWQCAYSEFYFCDTYWPDFDAECLYKAIVDFQHRQRRFGKTGDQVKEEAQNPS